jgi:UDP-N-acetylglucosamine 2-epimerase (hydrolysing)|tara:strand:+ start:2961 stop:4085 length:1125 start_codon:yes stop_codon:yes gene_type:complete
MKKKILFVTSTRADFGKLKSLIKITKKSKKFSVYIIVTGMHMMRTFGDTHTEITKFFKSNVIKFRNQRFKDSLDTILTSTVEKFSIIVKKIKPDLILIHGDRIESLGCALVGSLNHILTAHIEGGEVSGNIDDTIRHAVTKLSHIHFAGNNKAKKRILSMGEKRNSIFTIGSADMDILLYKKLPPIKFVKKKYDIKFKNYAILMWHPVTSSIYRLKKDTKKLINFVNYYNQNFVIIYPNNDPGTEIIIDSYKKLLKAGKNKIFESLRFERFVSLLKNSKFIIGNSSSGIYEAPALGIPTINIGERQHKRLNSRAIKNLKIESLNKYNVDKFLNDYKQIEKKYFGKGNTDKKFIQVINKNAFWKISTQKYYADIV